LSCFKKRKEATIKEQLRIPLVFQRRRESRSNPKGQERPHKASKRERSNSLLMKNPPKRKRGGAQRDMMVSF